MLTFDVHRAESAKENTCTGTGIYVSPEKQRGKTLLSNILDLPWAIHLGEGEKRRSAAETAVSNSPPLSLLLRP